eukprot:3414716-Alexandrium_andersonii.AAC.1
MPLGVPLAKARRLLAVDARDERAAERKRALGPLAIAGPGRATFLESSVVVPPTIALYRKRLGRAS